VLECRDSVVHGISRHYGTESTDNWITYHDHQFNEISIIIISFYCCLYFKC